MIPGPVIPIPIPFPIPLGLIPIPIPGFSKIHDSDSKSNSRSKRFWFQFQCYPKILILIPIPASCDSDFSICVSCVINSGINTYYVNVLVFDSLCWMFICVVSQCIQQAVFYRNNQFTLYGWEEISEVVNLIKTPNFWCFMLVSIKFLLVSCHHLQLLLH